jgi:hypothetical protein
MARTQIELEPEVQRRAVQRAQSLGLSLSAYVRKLVTRGGATGLLFDVSDGQDEQTLKLPPLPEEPRESPGYKDQH